MKLHLALSFSLTCLVASALVAAPQSLTTLVAEPGKIFEMGSISGDGPGTNNASFLIDLRAGATIRMLSPTTGKAAYFWSSLVVTNGAATIELADDITGISFYNNTIIRAPLTIKGKSYTSVLFRDQAAYKETPVRVTSTAQFDFSGGIAYQDETGAAKSPKVEFSHLGTYLSVPPADYQFTAGEIHPVFGENIYPGKTEIVYDDNYKFKIRLLSTNAIAPPQTFRLGQWRSVSLTPAVVPDFATTLDQTWTYCDGVYDFSIVQEHADADFTLASPSNVTFVGKLSGIGAMKINQMSENLPTTARVFGDLSEYTGAITIGDGQTLVVNTSLPGNAITIGNNGVLRFEAATETDDVSEISLGSVSSVHTAATRSGLVQASDGQSVSIARISGRIRLAVPDGMTAAFNVASWADGAVIRADPGATVMFDGKATPPKGVLFTPGRSTVRNYVMPDAGNVATIPPDLGYPKDHAGYVTYGDVSVAGVPAGYALTTADGTAQTLSIDVSAAEPTYAAIAAGSSGEIKPRIAPWRQNALLWIDPSVEETWCYHYKQQGTGTSRTESTTRCDLVTVSPDTNCPVLRGLVDVRGEEVTTLRMWNARPWMRKTYYEDVDTVMPFVSTACSSNSLAYLAFGNCASNNTRRINFVDYAGVTDDFQTYDKGKSISPKFVVMVYGSQKGGGYSILSTGTSAVFRRGADILDKTAKAIKASDPIMLSNNKGVRLWLNGTEVNPTTTGLSGGWDILSVDLSNVSSIVGFGGDADGNISKCSGGQYLGETIFLSSVPDEATRVDIERYLANKWGIASKMAAYLPQMSVRLAGAGSLSVSAACQATFTGSFAGTLNLAAGVTATFSGTTPYTEAEISALNPVFWIDPDAEGAITFDSAKLPIVGNVFQHDPDKRTIGTDLFLTANHGGRSPAAVRESRGLGPVRTWIDYNGTNETATSQGNTMRIHLVDDRSSDSDTNVPVRTGFIVQDSTRGGGTPFLQGVGAPGDVKERQTSKYDDPVYASGTSTKLTKSPIYLNGASANVADGFLGRDELFTFTASSTVKVGAFAWYNNTENGARQGEFQGEILLFSEALSDAVRTRVEAYLMQKWLGWMQTGYVDFSQATVTGAGALTVANFAVAPTLSEGAFEGTLTVEASTCTMTLVRGATAAEDRVKGAVCAPSATLSLPHEVTVNVASAVRPRPGRYTLFDVKSVGETTFVLADDSMVRTFFPDATIQTTGGKVELVLPAKGFMMFFR